MRTRVVFAAALLLVVCSGAFAQGEFSYCANGPITQGVAAHGYNAIDIGAACYAGIGAARGGTVTGLFWDSGGGGNTVTMGHSNSYGTTYCHCDHYHSWVGQYNNRNDIIASIGSTGHSTGCHVHFDIRRSGVRQYIPGCCYTYVSLGQHINYNYPGISN